MVCDGCICALPVYQPCSHKSTVKANQAASLKNKTLAIEAAPSKENVGQELGISVQTQSLLAPLTDPPQHPTALAHAHVVQPVLRLRDKTGFGIARRSRESILLIYEGYTLPHHVTIREVGENPDEEATLTDLCAVASRDLQTTWTPFDPPGLLRAK